MHPDVLYRITVGNEEDDYSYYVISNNMQAAADKLRKFLDDNNLLHVAARKLKRIDVIATELGSGIFEY